MNSSHRVKNRAAKEHFEGVIAVSTIRCQNPKDFGGCIFSGYEVNDEGEKYNVRELFVVTARAYLLPFEVSKGERWRVSGNIRSVEMKNFNGFHITEITIESEVPLLKERETGDLIISLVANNPKFKRIGRVRMQRLWNKYGNKLYTYLDTANLETLANELGEKDATIFIEAWRDHVSGSVISFLQAHNFPYWLAKKVLEFHGNNAQTALTEDPYLLVSFAARWELVDTLARQYFGIPDNDPRRLRAIIEESLYRLVDRGSHTCVPVDMVKKQISRLLLTKQLVDDALADKASNGAYLITDDKHFWPSGAFIMEEHIAGEIASMVTNPEPLGPSLFMSSMTESKIDNIIAEFEKREHERIGKPFHLTDAQREAVHVCVTNRFSVINGAAGTGKTSVLRCIYYVLERANYSVCQMALSGRAAKRMQVATGVDATTIAGYFRNAHKINDKLGDFAYYVVDEASMLDLPTTFQILRNMPEGKNLRMITVGDQYQLPPIGPGLVFPVLMEVEGIPVVHLTEVKRQEESSGIPAVANAIRHGILPDLPATGVKGVRFIPCHDRKILDEVLKLFAEKPDNTQILCATKNCSLTGTNAINMACRERFNNRERPLLVKSNAFEGAFCHSFREKDRLMVTRNDWKRGINNGLIGHLAKVYDKPVTVPGFDEQAIAAGYFEGITVDIFPSDIYGERPILQYGYGATVYKGQGSEWRRVIFPVLGSRNLDRTLIYTLITRAEDEVIMVGDPDALRHAVENEPKVNSRIVGLRRLLPQKIHKLINGNTEPDE